MERCVCASALCCCFCCCLCKLAYNTSTPVQQGHRSPDDPCAKPPGTAAASAGCAAAPPAAGLQDKIQDCYWYCAPFTPPCPLLHLLLLAAAASCRVTCPESPPAAGPGSACSACAAPSCFLQASSACSCKAAHSSTRGRDAVDTREFAFSASLCKQLRQSDDGNPCKTSEAARVNDGKGVAWIRPGQPVVLLLQGHASLT